MHTDERTNVEWINDKKWVKKHYFRKGMMSFLNDWYLYSGLKHTRSYREFEILNYLHGYKFNTCKPIVGWVTYSGLIYKANLVTETIQARTQQQAINSVHSHIETRQFLYCKIKALSIHLLKTIHVSSIHLDIPKHEHSRTEQLSINAVGD